MFVGIDVEHRPRFLVDGVTFDVIREQIDNQTIADNTEKRDELTAKSKAITAKLRRFRDFKRRVGK